MKKIIYQMLILFWLLPTALLGRQQYYAQVGKQIPEFTLDSIYHYSSSSVSSKDLKGNYVILDFFSKGCKGCFKSFPKMYALQQKYKGRLHIILVGYNSEGEKEVFENFMRLRNIELPVTFNRSMFKKMQVHGVPTLIWIDSLGVVRAISEEMSVTDDNIQAFLMGKPFKFYDWSFDAQVRRQKAFDKHRPMLINNNGGPDTSFMYRSVLRKWALNEPTWSVGELSTTRMPIIGSKTGIQVMGLPLDNLYKIAFLGKTDWNGLDGDTLFGKVWPKLILEVKDSSLFSWNFLESKNLFSYSLLVPMTDASVNRLKGIMQGDLHNYFGFKAALEERKVPYWAVWVDGDAAGNIKTKGGNPMWHVTMSKIEALNIPFEDFMDYLKSCFYYDTPIIDRSGFSGNIDIFVNADTENFGQVKDGLSKIGIRLVRRDTIMKTLVIKDEI